MSTAVPPSPAASPPRLDDLARGRNNNLNLLRFLAATAVVYAHSFGVMDQSAREPFFRLMDRGLGDFGVDIFFVVSGFLITKSLLGKDSLGAFAWARVMRVFPALWVSTLAWVLIAGLLLSPLPALQFWADPETLRYLAKNFTMLPGIGAETTLPHAFAFTDAEFNVPLWTLPHELQMYALLAGLAVLGIVRRGWVLIGITAVGLASLILDHAGIGFGVDATRARFLFFFFAGASFFAYRHCVVLRQWLCWALLAVVAATCLMTRDFAIRQLVLALATPYLVLAFAYGPAGHIRRFNAIGDYSYGIYIFAFPLQLIVAGYLAPMHPLAHFVLSMAAVLPFAALSWHYIERRMLTLPPPPAVARLIRLDVGGRSAQPVKDAGS